MGREQLARLAHLNVRWGELVVKSLAASGFIGHCYDVRVQHHG